MSGVGHLFHELEVGSHRVGEACHLAQLGNQDYLCSSLLVDTNYYWLIHIANARLILALKVLMISRLSAICIKNEGILWRLLEINVVHLVGPLVVTG